MKIKLTDPTNNNYRHATLDVSTLDVELEGVYNGVGIQTDQGLFGIAQRDGGIEVMLDGKLVFPLPFPERRKQLGDDILNDPGMEVSYRANVAMLLHDHFNKADFSDHDTRNEAASMILNLIFRAGSQVEEDTATNGGG